MVEVGLLGLTALIAAVADPSPGAFVGALLLKANTALPLALAAAITLAAALELRSSRTSPS